MNLIELSKYLQDEALAEKYLLDNGILKTWTQCPNCNSEKLGKISRGRIKCYKCKKEWHKRKDSILEPFKLDCGIFIATVKLFGNGFSIYDTVKEINIDKRTISRLFKAIGERLLPQSLFRKHLPQEYILYISSSNQIECKPLFDNDSQTDFPFEHCVITVTRKREIDNNYNFSLSVKGSKKIIKRFNQIDRFLSYSNYNIQFFRGYSESDFIIYLYELVMRFNHLESDCFSEILKKLRIC